MSKEITDEYVLSKKTITSHEAADYLGISWWALTENLQKGRYRFGTATLGQGGRWIYTIYSEKIYQFKHGIKDDLTAEADRLTEKVNELIAEIRIFNERMCKA